MEVREWVSETERLLEEVESLPDPEARNTAVAAVQALLTLYGETLARMLQHSEQLGGERLLQILSQDELVSHLLILHDLHPEDLRVRVQSRLDEVRPYLASHGGNVELLGVQDGMVRLRMLGNCNGCGSVNTTLKAAVEQAVYEAAPGVIIVEVEDSNSMTQPGAFVSVESLMQGVEWGD